MIDIKTKPGGGDLRQRNVVGLQINSSVIKTSCHNFCVYQRRHTATVGGTCYHANRATVNTRSNNSTEPVLVLASQILQALVKAANHRLCCIYRSCEYIWCVGLIFSTGISISVYQTNFTEHPLSRNSCHSWFQSSPHFMVSDCSFAYLQVLPVQVLCQMTDDVTTHSRSNGNIMLWG
jgi:hypothetical protein